MVALHVDMAKVSSNANHKALAIILAMAKIMIEMQTNIVAKIARNNLETMQMRHKIFLTNTCQKPHAIKPCHSLLYLRQNRKIATPTTETRIKAMLANLI